MIQSLLLFLGYCLGSFITMLAYRYPRMLLARGSTAKQLTLFYPRSHCPHCQHPLRWHDNIPLFSYLWLRGRCAHCQAAIGGCYWMSEAITLGITLSVLYQHSALPPLQLLGHLLFSWILIALAAIDWRSGLLPDRLTLGLLWLGLLFQIITQHIPLEQAVLGALLGYLLLWGLFQAHHRLTGRRGMGYGDFKLTAALGAWVGWQALLSVLWLASLLALLAFIGLLCWRRLTASEGRAQRPLGQQRLPFGPYLAFAGWWIFMQYPLPLETLLGIIGLSSSCPG